MFPTQQVLMEILGLGWSVIFGKYNHNGRSYIGEFDMMSDSGDRWEVKVRTQSNRGKYLKLKRKTGGKLKLRASADNYKLYDEYLPIQAEEWIAFAEYSQTGNTRLLPYLQYTLSQLTPKAHLIDT